MKKVRLKLYVLTGNKLTQERSCTRQKISQGLLSTRANYNVSPSIEREREKQREEVKTQRGEYATSFEFKSSENK